LPNTLVTGTAKGEASPVKRLRQRRNLDALRLLVDLYHAQYLTDDGGISRKVMERTYHRKRYEHCENRFIWGFTRGTETAYESQGSTEYFWQRETVSKHDGTQGSSPRSALWDAFSALRTMGLLMEVAHLVEHSNTDSEQIIAMAWDGQGEPLERSVAKAANAAARRMLGDTQDDAENADALIPVMDTLPDVQLVGIYRLRYRPHTIATLQWLRKLKNSATEWMREYSQLAEQDRSTYAASR